MNFIKEHKFEDDLVTVFAVLKAVAEGGLVFDFWASGKEVVYPRVTAKFVKEVRQDCLLIFEQVV